MAEYTAAAAQTVANGNNVLFTATPVCATRCIVQREIHKIVNTLKMQGFKSLARCADYRFDYLCA